MPKGVHHKRQAITREPPPEPPVLPTTIESLDKSQMAIVQAELRKVGSAMRNTLIEESEDIMATLIRVAKGILVERVDKEGDTYIYSVAPSISALKYLTEWLRLIAEMDPTPRENQHGVDAETRELLERYIAAKERPDSTAPQITDGAFVLGNHDGNVDNSHTS